jgi:hypothetical protein
LDCVTRFLRYASAALGNAARVAVHVAMQVPPPPVADTT